MLLAGVFIQGAWCLQSAEHGPMHGLGWLSWLAFGAWALWSVAHTPQQQLVWDGQDWRLQSGAMSAWVRPQVILDLQQNMLVLLRPAAGPAVWVWHTQKAQAERWLALRRALFNPASPVMSPDSTTEAAAPEA